MANNPMAWKLNRNLREGESLGYPESTLTGSVSYTLWPIKDGEGQEGNAVFLEMENRGNAVEAVELVGDVTLSVRAVEGAGLLLRHSVETGEVEAIVLAAGDDMDDTEAVELVQGDSYAYLNVGRGAFIVRDECTPAFKPEYEIPATNEELLRTLGNLGVIEYQ